MKNNMENNAIKPTAEDIKFLTQGLTPPPCTPHDSANCNRCIRTCEVQYSNLQKLYKECEKFLSGKGSKEGLQRQFDVAFDWYEKNTF